MRARSNTVLKPTAVSAPASSIPSTPRSARRPDIRDLQPPLELDRSPLPPVHRTQSTLIESISHRDSTSRTLEPSVDQISTTSRLSSTNTGDDGRGEGQPRGSDDNVQDPGKYSSSVEEYSEETAPRSSEGELEADVQLRRIIEELLRQQAERERRLLASQARIGTARKGRKWLLIVASHSRRHSESPLSSSASETSEVDVADEAVLLPLAPTLADQTRLVAREFALPTTHGITLHLCFPDLVAQNPDSDPIPSFAASSSLSPSVDEHRHVSRLRLTDASWKVLWADHLEGRGAPEPIQGVNGLPIAGRIQFDRLPPRINGAYSRKMTPDDSRLGHRRPRFGTSRSYARPITPSWTDSRSETRTSFRSGDELDPFPVPEAARGNSNFHARPLSLASLSAPPSSPPNSRTSSRHATPTNSRSPRLPSPVKTPLSLDEGSSSSQSIQDSGFRESTPITRLRSDSTVFPFPIPKSRHHFIRLEDESVEEESLEVGESILDWTLELNRLREISETSLFREVEDQEPKSEESSDRLKNTEDVVVTPSAERGTTPISSSAVVPYRYPFFCVYPPVYPNFAIYPSTLGCSSSAGLPRREQEGRGIATSFDDLTGSMDHQNEPVTTAELDVQTNLSQSMELALEAPAGTPFVDPSVEWYQSATPIHRSPVSSSGGEDGESEEASDSEGEGEDLFAGYDGTMLTTIQEESYTTSLTAQMAANDDPRAREQVDDWPTSDFGEDNETFSAVESYPQDIPVIVRTRPSISSPSGVGIADSLSPPRPSALDLRHTPRSPSPLPSPTITPSSIVTTDASSFDDHASPSEADELDYEFEYEAEGGTGELPYLSSPGLREALGFDDSPEILPFPFPTDESDIDSDEARDFTLESGATLGPDDSCQTFDHLSPLPDSSFSASVSPIVYAFASFADEDFSAAVAQFVFEAQEQALRKKGSFKVVLGNGDLPDALGRVLEFDQRIEWNRWEVFLLSGSEDAPERSHEVFLSRTAIPRAQIHLDGLLEVEVAENRLLLRGRTSVTERLPVSGGNAEKCEHECPRLDLALLDVGDLRDLGTRQTSALDGRMEQSSGPPSETSHSTCSTSTSAAAHQSAVFASGTRNRPILSDFVDRPSDHRIKLDGHPPVFFVDDSAMDGIEYPRASFWED